VGVRAAEDEGLVHPRGLQPCERVLDHRHVHQWQQHLRRGSSKARSGTLEASTGSRGGPDAGFGRPVVPWGARG
jgi:hypothetical protein